MNIYRLEALDNLTIAPKDRDEFAEWIKQEDVIPFLESEVEDEYVILFALHNYTYIESMLIPNEEISASQMELLKDWQPLRWNSWGISSDQDRTWLEPALADQKSDLMRRGEPLFYLRGFEGDSDLRSYYELPQKLTHVLDLHYIDGRKAWCKLDHLGDIVEVVKLLKSNEMQNRYTFIVMRRDALAEYAGLTNTQLLRMFDFTRLRWGHFHGWNGQTVTAMPVHPSIAGKLGIITGFASYTRGVQIVPLALSQEAIHKRYGMSSALEEERDYATFIALDVKHGRIAELSSDPKELDSYFEDTGKPLEISPVFFKPEVLSKYKADDEKYTLKNRSIDCRGSWSLQTYDINEAGQVHTYLVYLGHLPYEEQLHWKQFNEPPKTGISKRAFVTDIQGQWHSEYDPLESLKHNLETLNKEDDSWWMLKGANRFDKVHYPVSSSQKEWADELLNLDQLLIEGLNERWLRARAEALGQKVMPQHRSLKLLELCLIGMGFEEEHAYELLSPLHELHNLRSKVKGHVQGEEARQIIRDVKRKHGSFREHYKALSASLDESLESIMGAMG